MPTTSIDLSVVVPVLNEEQSLAQLVHQVDAALAGQGLRFEVVFINDGSVDRTPEILDDLAARNPHVSVIHLRRNFGKARALTEGFAAARGELVVTMDGDLQDDPEEIPRLLGELDRGADVVSGWKRERRDPWHKTIPSRLFNRVTSVASGLYLNDHNSGLKAYRREVLRHLELVGEMHRFVTVMAHWKGYRVTEIPVRHHPRKFGASKYGALRLFTGALDLLTALLTTRYNFRPLHLFGLVGLGFSALGVGVLGYLSVLWFMGRGPIGNRPLLFLGLLLTMVGVQFVSTGLLAELIVRQPNSGTHRDGITRSPPPA
ncbi:MAG TPA: glycosyltransferase family 2 protein [Longimicrobiales bacterium]|nr:glycosyltransferase family 2 protein [Longimicrobiales bacterium]